jgi:hypothetical protein
LVRAEGLIYCHYSVFTAFLLYTIHIIALIQYDLLGCDTIRSSHLPVVMEIKMAKLQEPNNAGLKINATKTKETRINSSIEPNLY